MNIFYLDNDPKLAAQYHVDKHCVKMILETAQLLSTAHRVLDGTEHLVDFTNKTTGQVKKKKVLVLSNALQDKTLYSATHINHPSAIWCRKSLFNYQWLYRLMIELCKEYTYRYGKVHKCESSGLLSVLGNCPDNISIDEFTEPTPAMPDQYKVSGDSVQSYHNYYNGEKTRMFSWKKRDVPFFINKNI
jgi:hypothetical protein